MKRSSNIDELGKKNPFIVPEGYFEHFSEELMQKLPAQEESAVEPQRITLWMRVRPWVYMAAMFCGILLCTKTVFNISENISTDATAAVNEEEYSSEYVETLLDNTMMNDYTVYCYLTEADINY